MNDAIITYILIQKAMIIHEFIIIYNKYVNHLDGELNYYYFKIIKVHYNNFLKKVLSYDDHLCKDINIIP